MKDNLSGGISPDELKTMSDGFITMGENLSKISGGLKTFHEKIWNDDSIFSPQSKRIRKYFV